MASQVATTEAVLRKRILAINDSILVSFSSSIPDTFSVLNYASCLDSNARCMYRCQENFIGYRFGKLIERLYQEYSEEEAYSKAKEHYKELQCELRRQGKTYHSFRWGQFKCYCGNMVQYVNEFGIYCLFIPDVLSPTKFKRTPCEDFKVLLRYIDETCSVFRGIAQVDGQGNIIAP